MNGSIFILKGDICYSRTPSELAVQKDGYVVCRDGTSEGVYERLPDAYENCPVQDTKGALIVPGLVDLHIHAPQYTFRGLGMDLELLDWLNAHTFPEEAKYSDTGYAAETYERFTQRLKFSATTRACIFGTVHVPATELLMDMLEKSGLRTLVGKVNMDRNAPDYLTEASADASAEDTVEWIKDCRKRYRNTKPILTPRFIPTCTDVLMENLKKIQMRYGLPVQSHLSENVSEVKWVQELCPESEFYGDAYDRFGLFGADAPTVMAHCVHSDERERRRMKENNVFVAHCPESNMNLSSGIAPVRAFLEEGIPTGLGSDVAGGTTENLFAAMAHAIQASKLRWRLVDESLQPLTAAESFYLATKGGGAFFGKVGSFEQGYEFDAVIIDDSAVSDRESTNITDRLERLIYVSGEAEITGKYAAGEEVFRR
ncbi:guanine deaminase [Lachnospiraceae bacterium]|uniref:amidohydrolase family protein n=1 Tax=Extibacter sp. GGCC_0201 TaxID=2731209 RepID=UPI001AA0B550|nr:amidohydrolase family protein [Extibacter sp. GGCC_0201]BDF34742.1 guanine deaminase [Lachnospiraceae bacterium]BDF38744.1 guanine deaminase [Lachnospiraceae bacterium]